MINSMQAERGWLIHAYPVRDHLYLLYILMPHQILKAFYRRRRGQPLPQIFLPYWWSLTSKQENHQVQSVECLGPGLDLKGLELFVGLYMNELIFQLARQADVIPHFYSMYEAILQAPFEVLPLRQFEWQLLADCGYAIDFSQTADLHPIVADAYYGFHPEQGFHLRNSGISGVQLLAIHEARYDALTLSILKKILITMIDYLLDGKVLHSRALLKNWIETHAN